MIAREIDRAAVTAETTGDRLRRLRLARGWSQERLAEEAAIDRQTVSYAERRATDLFASTLEALAVALDTTMDYLWAGRDTA
jgi:transcriptional regulator with XRE-family HTH domain